MLYKELDDEIQRYYKFDSIIKYLKRKFSNKYLVDEIMKSITALIINEKTFDDESKNYDPVIPLFNNEEFNQQLLTELGANRNIDNIYNVFEDIKRGFESKKNQVYTKQITVKSYSKFTTLTAHRIKANNFFTKIPTTVYNKLRMLYDGGGNTNNDGNTNETQRIFIMWLRYYSISRGRADGYQWAIEPSLMNSIRQNLGVEMELFSSPINVLGKNMKYCSLFYDTDCYFGSCGNYTDYIKNIEGVIEMNPPFIEKVQDDVVQKLLEKCKEENEKKIVVIGFVADWKDSLYYNLLSNSENVHFLECVNIPFKSKGRNVLFNKLNFDTCIFIASNCNADNEVKTLKKILSL